LRAQQGAEGTNPRGGALTLIADVSLIKTMWSNIGLQGVKWKRDPRGQ